MLLDFNLKLVFSNSFNQNSFFELSYSSIYIFLITLITDRSVVTSAYIINFIVNIFYF